jgi:hypothetical protein
MPRFAILEHDYPILHWDLLLESGPVLRTWRLGAPPEPGKRIDAAPSFDHRLVYLDYEGPISGGRGQVKRWDVGTFTWEEEAPERIAIRLEGRRFEGLAILERDASSAWSLVMQSDNRT